MAIIHVPVFAVQSSAQYSASHYHGSSSLVSCSRQSGLLDHSENEQIPHFSPNNIMVRND